MQIIQSIKNRMYEIRGERVKPDFDLAQLYETGTKALNQAVKRNSKRFPPDFMFRLAQVEWQGIRSQSLTASPNKRNMAFTFYTFTPKNKPYSFIF